MFGECQSLLLNFESLLVSEFGVGMQFVEGLRSPYSSRKIAI